MNKLGLGIYSVTDQESNTTGRTVNIQTISNKLCLCVCPCACVCVFCIQVSLWMHVFVHVKARTEHYVPSSVISTFLSWGRVPCWIRSSLLLARLAGQGESMICLSLLRNTGVTSVSIYAKLFLWVLGVQTHISTVRVVIHWAIFSSSRKTSFVPLEFML